MSIEPPKTESQGSGIPGMVIPLVFVSIILLVAILIFGALAFDFTVPGMSSDDEVEYAAPEDVMQPAGFTLRDRTSDGESTLVNVEVTVLNTGEQPVEAFQLLVQCDDDGYVSAIQDVSGMEPDESRTVAMKLAGRGEPSCHDPVIEFAGRGSAN